MTTFKLTRLHSKDAHAGRDSVITYWHDSSLSEYGYKDYRIKSDGTFAGWFVEKDGKRLTSLLGLSFREARNWLKEHIKNERNNT